MGGEGGAGKTHHLSSHITYQPLPTLQAGAGSCESPFPPSAQASSQKTLIKCWLIEGGKRHGFPKEFCFSSGPKTVQTVKQGHGLS